MSVTYVRWLTSPVWHIEDGTMKDTKTGPHPLTRCGEVDDGVGTTYAVPPFVPPRLCKDCAREDTR